MKETQERTESRLRFLKQRRTWAGGWATESAKSRAWEDLYRRRWAHDKEVRTTHGVNCTGACSWKVHVKDGLITFETQATDYPSTGRDCPDYEPRGCARGASFSWYEYSPLRVKYPYVRAVLLTLWRAGLESGKDPVSAWAAIAEDPEKMAAIRSARGHGGFVRSTWDEVTTLIAAACIHTIRRYGPDRVVGFSPIPAMSPVSYTAGARFLSLIGGTLLSFYDWYADLPPASPQIWGEQTDVPESADWYNAKYFIIWGTNLPMTRTPDAHFLVEARYNGTKVAAVSPDYAEYVKFADTWLPAKPGTDGALALAMLHVILKEFYVDRETPYFVDYVRRFTDLPFLVTLRRTDAGWVSDRFLNARDIGDSEAHAEWKTVVWDLASGELKVPNGSVGFRWDGSGRWNLRLEDGEGAAITPALTLLNHADDIVQVQVPVFDTGRAGAVSRGVPVRRVTSGDGEVYVTTVFDLLMAQVGVDRGLPGDYPKDYVDPRPGTPAWQEGITGVDRRLAIRVAREFADNAERTRGRSMIALGAGTNHWYHSDATYRAIIALVLVTGCQGVNGGGWAHYVGQEKVRPLEGWSTVAFATDWVRPPRQMNGTSFFYFTTEQFRHEEQVPGIAAPGATELAHMHPADLNALAVRLGWLPSFPQFVQNPLDVIREARERGQVWADESVSWRPAEVTLAEHAPIGKLDLLVDIDFRMTGTGVYADIVLPAATWYEKHDLSTTDMHPFIHPFQPAIDPPWQARTDWDAFRSIAERFSELAARHLPACEDLVMAPLLHDTPDELAQPLGKVRDWRRGDVPAIPGKTMPKFTVVRRNYPNVAQQLITLGPLAERSITFKGITVDTADAIEELARRNGRVVDAGTGTSRVRLESDRDVAEAILTLSGATNGRLAQAEWAALEGTVGLPLRHIAEGHSETMYRYQDLIAQPRQTLAAPAWSGLESSGRRYAPFTANVEHLIPWRTLTGRQHLYVDHQLMLEFGEALPVYRPPLHLPPFAAGEAPVGAQGGQLIVRYLTPHQKWGIHSTYADNIRMLTLFRGGPVIWLNEEDARATGIRDNDWVEVYNRNGVIVARAVLTYRMPRGVAMMYHAQDRVIGVPGSRLSGTRGGTHNSVTRIQPKPTHMIGGYAQLSYGFNDYGPTGHQRDVLAVIRPLGDEVDWLERQGANRNGDES